MDSKALRAQLNSPQTMCRRGEGFAADLNLTEDGTIRGQAVPFNKIVRLSADLFERFEPTAFQDQEPRTVKIHLEHDRSPIGRISTLTPTETGLAFTGSISTNPQLTDAAKARALLADDLMDEVSIGFRTVPDGFTVNTRSDGATLVTHHKADLREISLVAFGVYGRDATLARSVLIDPSALELEARRQQIREELAAIRRGYEQE
jgi:HK97 family phage prohead protease